MICIQVHEEVIPESKVLKGPVSLYGIVDKLMLEDLNLRVLGNDIQGFVCRVGVYDDYFIYPGNQAIQAFFDVFSSLNVSTMAVKGIFSLMPQSSIIFGESGKGLRKFLGKGLNRFAK